MSSRQLDLMWTGNEFQAAGPATVNELGNEFQAAGPVTVNELSANRVLVRRCVSIELCIDVYSVRQRCRCGSRE